MRGRTDERDFEVGEKILSGLEPDREPHEVPRRRKRGVRRGGMRHPSGMLDQALDAAERLRELEDIGLRYELDRLLLGLDQERDHAAEVAHLAGGDLVAGMRRQARIEHLLDSRVT